MPLAGVQPRHPQDFYLLPAASIVRKRKPHDLKESWKDVQPLAMKMIEHVDKARENGEKVAVWCAGHFAFTVLSTTGIGEKISYIIDNAAFKQGHFAPASHVTML